MSRQAEHIKRQVEAGGSQINIVISARAKKRLDDIKYSQSMTQKAAIDQLLTEGILLKGKVRKNLERIAERQSLTEEGVLEWLIYEHRLTDRAHELMEKHGDKNAAMTEYLAELNLDYPGFALSKRELFPVANMLFSQMNTALGWEEMNLNVGKDVTNVVFTGESTPPSGILRSIFQGFKSRSGR